MQFGHYNSERGHARLLLDANRNTGTIVGDTHAFIFVNCDPNVITTALHGFVDGVVHHFVDHVMQRLGIGAANVHTRATAHRLQPFQNLDLFCFVNKILVAFPVYH